MKKLEKVEIDYKRLNPNRKYETKYDDLFEDKIKNRGANYQAIGLVKDIKKNNNEVTAVVQGTDSYNVKIVFLPNNKIDVSCTCPYHKDTNIYCKHIYALLEALIASEEIKEISNDGLNNIDRINEIREEGLKLLEDNKDHLYNSSYNLLKSDLNRIDTYHDEIKQKLESNNNYQISYATRLSYVLLNEIIDTYNELIDTIENEQVNQEEDKKKIIEVNIFETDNKELFDYLDDVMASQDLSVLEAAREQCIKDGEEHDLIDKAITERKRRDKIEAERQKRIQKIEEERERRLRKAFRRAAFFGAVSGFFGGLGDDSSSNLDLNPWEQDYIDKNAYEPFRFEEEDLEEDDFYFEDDK